MNLLETPTGHLANLSTIAAKPFERAFNDEFIAPEETEIVAVDGLTLEAARDQILVYLEDDISSEELRDVDALITAQGARRLALNTRLRTIQVALDTDVSEASFIDALTAAPGVHFASVNAVVEPDAAVKAKVRHHASNPGRFASPVFNSAVTSTALFTGDYWIDDINAESAWAALTRVGLQRSPLGIVDTGLRSSQGVVDESRLQRFTAGGAPRGGYLGTSNHGLWVTGFAAGEHKSSGQRGVNTHSDVILVDAERRGVVYESAVLSGIQTAIDNGAKVVNVSFGGGAKCVDSSADRLASRTRWRRTATNVLSYARRRDALVVWSAGSDCEKNDDRHLLVAARESQVHDWQRNALIVGASDESGADACFSAMGDVVDLMAPGEAITFAAGRSLLDGTSYAAPLVSGVGALVRAVGHTFSAPATKVLLSASAAPSITHRTAAMNDTACADRYPGGVTTANKPGEATRPEELLDFGLAVESAIVAASVPLTTSSTVMLRRDKRAHVQVEVHVPSTGVASADVVFLIDQTGSFEDDVKTIQRKADAILEHIGGRRLDVRYGVAGFGDYTDDASGQTVFALHQELTDSVRDTKGAFDDLTDPLLLGGDAPEAQYEALIRTIGQFRWRVGALRVILLATDAPFHDSDVATDYPGIGRVAALGVVQRENVVIIGLQSGGDETARDQLGELALATGGSAQVLDASSTEIAEAIEEGLDFVLGSVDVELDVISGNPWVLGVTPFAHRDVSPGTTVSFRVHLEGKMDSSIDSIAQDIHAWAWGDGSALVGRVRVPVIVPSEPSWRLSRSP